MEDAVKNKIISLVDRIRSSYWFIPTLMLIFSVLLSIVAVELDNRVSGELQWVIAVVRVQSTEAARAPCPHR